MFYLALKVLILRFGSLISLAYEEILFKRKASYVLSDALRIMYCGSFVWYGCLRSSSVIQHGTVTYISN